MVGPPTSVDVEATPSSVAAEVQWVPVSRDPVAARRDVVQKALSLARRPAAVRAIAAALSPDGRRSLAEWVRLAWAEVEWEWSELLAREGASAVVSRWRSVRALDLGAFRSTHEVSVAVSSLSKALAG